MMDKRDRLVNLPITETIPTVQDGRFCQRSALSICRVVKAKSCSLNLLQQADSSPIIN
jgi:hypothetical protein